MNKKTVRYGGLVITGDANEIDKLIYDKGKQVTEVIEYTDYTKTVEDIYKFNSLFIAEDIEDNKKVEWMKQFIICVQDELSELLSELPWKHWKNYDGFEMNVNNIRGELADILIFTFGMAGIMGITPNDMLGEIHNKNKTNFRRQEGGY